jgi:hypothetical protein
MHFGLYLKKKGIISAEQLVDALEEQTKKLVPIGQLALEEGILMARDIFKVLQAQNDSPNVRFGDLAVEMGLMTRDDVMRLLMIQADRKRPLGEILASQKVLSEEQVAREMVAYRQSLLRPQRGAMTYIVKAPRVKPMARPAQEAVAAI